jgi:hypothetical protein
LTVVDGRVVADREQSISNTAIVDSVAISPVVLCAIEEVVYTMLNSCIVIGIQVIARAGSRTTFRAVERGRRNVALLKG